MAQTGKPSDYPTCFEEVTGTHKLFLNSLTLNRSSYFDSLSHYTRKVDTRNVAGEQEPFQ